MGRDEDSGGRSHRRHSRRRRRRRRLDRAHAGDNRSAHIRPPKLHAIHIAELTDCDGWELLIKLAEELGQDDMAANFRGALVEEERHLSTIRELITQSCMREAGVA